VLCTVSKSRWNWKVNYSAGSNISANKRAWFLENNPFVAAQLTTEVSGMCGSSCQPTRRYKLNV
jgi:hypothetical protein